MKDSLKVALWEIKRNLKNKSFLLSIILTPVMMIIFGGLPTLLSMLESSQTQRVYVKDDLGIYQAIKAQLPEDEIELILHEGPAAELRDIIAGQTNTSYVVLDPTILDTRIIALVTADEGIPSLEALQQAISDQIMNFKMLELGLEPDQIESLTGEYAFVTISMERGEEDWTRKIVPAVFAGFILIAVSIFGTMTFNSSITDKKDKMAEILLSSISANSMMQGKIIGYFILGMIQTLAWIGIAIPVAQFYFEIPVLSFLIIPELPLMLFYAMLGYLLFSAIFVSMGATIDDIQEAGNFQSIIFILPWLPMFFIGAIITNPNGILAKVGTYFPLTTPGVMLFRLAFLSRIPVLDVLVSSAILLISTWLVIRLAGKIFRTGILMTGKNATPKEIWRWLRQ